MSYGYWLLYRRLLFASWGGDSYFASTSFAEFFAWRSCGTVRVGGKTRGEGVEADSGTCWVNTIFYTCMISIVTACGTYM